MQLATRSRSSWLAATSLHVAGLLLLLLAAVKVAPPPGPPLFHVPIPVQLHLVPPPPPMKGKGGDSGGGHSDPDPAQQGAPPKPAPRTFIMQAISRPEPSVLEIITGAEVPEIEVAFTQVGDPLGLASAGSLGDGRGIGIGSKDGSGIGPGDSSKGAPGIGGSGDDVGSIRRVTRGPVVIHQVEPQYSEPARKAQLQGVVKLRIDVGVDGRATNIRVIQGIGLGLDQAAVDAVKQWRFQPAMSGNQPVVAAATVEVGFHLL